MSKTKILVCCHKQDTFKSDEVYMPIHVGKALSKYDLSIQGDDEGDNISSENPHFCELTGLYWAWKNMTPVDYIGLCHYRRYFNFHDKGTMFSDYTVIKSKDFESLDLSLPDIDNLFKRYDIIISKPRCYPYSLAIDYSVCQVSEDLRSLFTIVEKLYPEYMSDMNEVFNKSNKLSHYNMMIMRWHDFDKYCKWLFNILFEAKKEINIEHYNAVQGRIWGYMSERLLSVYVRHERMNVKHFPIYWINDDVIQKSFINRMTVYYRYMLSFALNRPYK